MTRRTKPATRFAQCLAIAVLWTAGIVPGCYGATAAPDPDPAFFANLDLSRLEMARVRVLVGRKDFQAAKIALSDHFRDRRVRAGFWPTDSRSAQDPDALVRHVFSFYGSKPFDAGSPIRWDGVFHNDRELTYALNRHQHLATLGVAYRRTKDPKYARAFAEQIRDWIKRHNSPEDRNWAAWRNLEAAMRVGVWSDVFFQFLAAPEFPAADQATMLQSLYTQAKWLAPQVESGGGQWSPSLATGLAAVALLFPEFKESAGWRDAAYAVLVRSLQNETYPDGSNKALSPHQHNATMSTFWLPLKLAVENRFTVPQVYRDTLERMSAYQAYLRRPDGRYPAFNASDSQDCRPLLTAAAKFFGRPDFAYILTHGRSGTAPSSTSVAFGPSGVHIMRDKWSAEANYLALDAGPYGVSFQHEDKLGFELAAFGRTVLVDPGRYSLNPTDPLTGYLTKTTAHNTLTVDGAGQQRSSFSPSWTSGGNPPNCWVSRPAFDYFAGAYIEGYRSAPGVKHFRRAFFVKDNQQPYWIVSDRIAGSGRHRLAARFQFAPGALERKEPLRFATQSPKGNLAICPPANAAANAWKASVLTGSRKPFGGWVSPAYGKIQPAPQLLYERQTTLPATMEYVLVPSRDAAAIPTVRERSEVSDPAAKGDVTVLEIDFGKVRDTVFIAHDLRKADRKIAGLQTRGCFVVVRTDGSGAGKVLIDSDAGQARPPSGSLGRAGAGGQSRSP